MMPLDLTRTAKALTDYDVAQAKWAIDTVACAREWYESLPPEKQGEVVQVLSRQEGIVGPKPTLKSLLEPDFAAVLELAWLIMEEERLAREVGRAFGLDTADRNSLDTCESCVRPNVWLRKQVEEWRASAR